MKGKKLGEKDDEDVRGESEGRNSKGRNGAFSKFVRLPKQTW